MDQNGHSTTERGERSDGERGAGLVEYALLLALIAVACLVALSAFGITNGGSINNTASTYSVSVN